MLYTLEIFGLPKSYIDGEGHHLNWEQQKAAAAAGGRNKKKNKAPGKTNKALKKLQADLATKKAE